MKTTQTALYARVSSDQQANTQTIASQLATLRERMQTDGCTSQPELEFVDEGWSGATLMRPAMERLRDAAAFGAIDRLYVHSPDRLARKYAYQVLLIDELQRTGVEIVFLNHALGQSPEDDLLLQVQGMVAEYERAKIMERSRRGKRHKAQNGQVSVLSSAPYGYRYVRVFAGGGAARMEIQPQEAQVVRRIFGWIGHERASIGEVCRRLENQQVLSPRGNQRWDRTTVLGILRNPTYKGMAVFGKTRTVPGHPALRPHRRQQLPVSHSVEPTDPSQWIGIPVLAIIDPDLFVAVQEQLQENRARARARRCGATYLLQGLLVCKQCGYAYYGKSVGSATAKSRKRDYAYYRCIGTDAYRFGGQRICRNTQVRTDLLEEAVWQEVCALLNAPYRLQQEYSRRLQELTQPAEDSVRSGLEKQLRQCRRGIARLIDAYTEGYVEKADFETRINHLKERQQTLENQRRQWDAATLSQAELQLIIGRLEDFSARVKTNLDEMDFLERRELIRTLVKRVEIDHEHVNVVFRVETPPDGSGPVGNLQHCGRRGGTFRRCQSTPVTSHCHCSFVRAQTVSSTEGHLKRPLCRRRLHSQTPVPSQTRSLRRVAARLRKA